MQHVENAWCVAHDLHTIAPPPFERTCWRRWPSYGVRVVWESNNLCAHAYFWLINWSADLDATWCAVLLVCWTTYWIYVAQSIFREEKLTLALLCKIPFMLAFHSDAYEPVGSLVWWQTPTDSTIWQHFEWLWFSFNSRIPEYKAEDLCNLFVAKWQEVAQTVAMVDNVRRL